MVKTDNFLYETYGFFKYWDGICQVRIYEHDGRTVVRVTELPRNKGISVTNSIERIAQKLKDERNLPKDTIWIEHYPDRRSEVDKRLDRHDSMLSECFATVTFGRQEPFGDVKWLHTPREVYLALIGEAGL